jgi:hypothetical protein
MTSRITIGAVVALVLSGCGAQSTDVSTSTQSKSALASSGSSDTTEPGKGRPVRRVLLLSVDGLHRSDVDHWVKNHSASTLARLTAKGTTYSSATTTTPSDSFPGLLALVTGGTPRSTGVFYDDSYDRTLYPPGSGCTGNPGTEVVFDESVDNDMAQLFSGGINPLNLPLALVHKKCVPVYPHDFLRANTVFEVVRDHGGRTAWSDKHPSYDLVNGPSGKGVEDLYTPEINSNIANGGTVNGVSLSATLALCNGTNSLPVSKVAVYTDCIPAVEAYDDVKVQAVLNEIEGKRSDGTPGKGVPTVFGMNFQAVSVGQKLPVGGYVDASGTPGPVLAGALAHTDASIGKMVAALEKKGLLDDTLVIVTAKHGQSPIDRARLAMEGGGHAPVQSVVDPVTFVNLADPNVDNVPFTNPLPGSNGGSYQTKGHLQTDDVGIVWLQDQSQKNVAAVIAQLVSPANAAAMFANVLPAGTIFESNVTYGDALAAIFGDPTDEDSLAAARAPNAFIQPNEGVIYSGSSKKIAEHGGGAPGDIDVALLVVGPGAPAGTVATPVTTTQVAPTILRALGIDPGHLDAVRREGTRPLPTKD